MALEIERKFLVRSDAWRTLAHDPRPMKQAYLGGDRCSIRIRVAGEQAWLTLKSATLDISRLEFEYPLPLEDADCMLRNFAAGPMLEKTRYHVPAGALTWEIDVFHGENHGLVLAEIELPHRDTAAPKPAWLGPEVSGDPRYLNVNLARHPWRRWSQAERSPC